MFTRKTSFTEILSQTILLCAPSDGLPCLIDFGAVKELMSTTVKGGGLEKSSLVIGSPGFYATRAGSG